MRFLSLILLLCSTSTIAQHKFYIGFEAGTKLTHSFITDEGSHLAKDLGAPFRTYPLDFTCGVNVNYNVTENLQLGSGLMTIPFPDRFALTTDSTGTGGTSWGLNGWLIPLEARFSLNLVKNKLFVVPFISASMIILPKAGIHHNLRTEDAFGDFSYTYNTVVVRRIGTLIGSGIKVDLNTAKCTFITLSVSYHKGLSRILEMDINYETGNSGPLQGTIHTNGGMTHCSIGVRFPITSIHHKHE